MTKYLFLAFAFVFFCGCSLIDDPQRRDRVLNEYDVEVFTSLASKLPIQGVTYDEKQQKLLEDIKAYYSAKSASELLTKFDINDFSPVQMKYLCVFLIYKKDCDPALDDSALRPIIEEALDRKDDEILDLLTYYYAPIFVYRKRLEMSSLDNAALLCDARSDRLATDFVVLMVNQYPLENVKKVVPTMSPDAIKKSLDLVQKLKDKFAKKGNLNMVDYYQSVQTMLERQLAQTAPAVKP